MYVLARFGRDSCSAYIISGIISGAPSGSLSIVGQKHRGDAEKHTLPRNGLSRNGLSRVTSLVGRAAWLSHASSHTIYCNTLQYTMLYYFILYCTTLYCADRPTQTLGGGALLPAADPASIVVGEVETRQQKMPLPSPPLPIGK